MSLHFCTEKKSLTFFAYTTHCHWLVHIVGELGGLVVYSFYLEHTTTDSAAASVKFHIVVQKKNRRECKVIRSESSYEQKTLKSALKSNAGAEQVVSHFTINKFNILV